MPEVTTQNSYVTMEQADEIFDMTPGCEEWATFDDNKKARLLIHATKMLSHIVFGDVGEISTAAWTTVELNKARFVEATLAQAWFWHMNRETIDQSVSDYIEGKTSEAVGPISSTKNGGPMNYKKMFSPTALAMMDIMIVTSKKLLRA